LTKSEASKLEIFVEPYKTFKFGIVRVYMWFWLLFNYFFFCIHTALYPSRHGDHTVLIFAVEFTCCVVLPTALLIMARSHDAKSNVRLFILTTLFYFGFLVADMLLRHVGSVSIPLLVIINFKPIFIFLRACYKCLRWKQTWPQIPPQDTAVS
jgi:hypothetical protein